MGRYTFTLLDANGTVLLTTNVVVGSQLLTGLTPGALYTANIVTNNSVGVSAPAAFSFYAASTDPSCPGSRSPHACNVLTACGLILFRRAASGVPGAPQQLAVFAQTALFVSLAWNAPAANGNLTITDYQVTYSTPTTAPTSYLTGNRRRAWVRHQLRAL